MACGVGMAVSKHIVVDAEVPRSWVRAFALLPFATLQRGALYGVARGWGEGRMQMRGLYSGSLVARVRRVRARPGAGLMSRRIFHPARTGYQGAPPR